MIEFPSVRPDKMTAGLTSNSKVFKSAFNNSTSAVTFAGSYITASLSYDELTYANSSDFDEAAEMDAFIFEVNGIAGIVKLPMFHRPGYPAKGQPITSVAGQLGGVINTSGWHANALILKRGQYITVNDELKMVMQDLFSDSLGNATITFAPWLRNSPSVGTAIITQDPYGFFRLTDDSQEITFEQVSAGVSFNFEEAFYV